MIGSGKRGQVGDISSTLPFPYHAVIANAIQTTRHPVIHTGFGPRDIMVGV